MKEIVYLNGEFINIVDAKISVLDRGFLFGDGIYEVIPSFGGHLFRLEQHLKRLERSLRLTQIPMPEIDFKSLVLECLKKNESENDAIYLQITRGAGHARILMPAKSLTPTVFIACLSPPLHTIEQSRIGVAAITSPDLRWHHCDIKAITLLPNIMARLSAENHHVTETIMIREEMVTEGCASNVFVVKDGGLITPTKTNYILGGVTRELVIEIADANNIPCHEAPIMKSSLDHADEIWLTSSTRDIVPVVQLNEMPVGTGKAGPLWEKMIVLFNEYKKNAR